MSQRSYSFGAAAFLAGALAGAFAAALGAAFLAGVLAAVFAGDFEAALAGALVTLASPEIAAAWAAIADLRFAAWFL